MVHGRNAVREALRHGKARRLYLREGEEALSEEAAARGVPCVVLPRSLFRRRFPQAAQGVAAEVDRPTERPLAELLEDAVGVLLALDHLMDPQNLGAILRTCAAFGVRGVILPERRQAPVTEAVIRASAGYAFGVALYPVANLQYALRRLQEQWPIAILDAHEGTPLSEAKIPENVILVAGSEGEGVRPVIRKLADLRLRIPLEGGVDSLNVSVATAIALYEWRRQRGG